MNRHNWTRSEFVGLASLVMAVILVGCNAPLTPTAASVSPDAARPAFTPTSTAAPKPTLRPTLIPTPAPTAIPDELVWFGPNMGSVDFPDLFSNPQAWAKARSKIDVFKFYTQNLLDDPCSICGSDILHTFVGVDAFKSLAESGIATAIEVGAVKEWGCTSDVTFGVADTVIRNVEDRGGRVDFLAMDEPLIGGGIVVNGSTCGYTMEQSAGATAKFIGRVHSAYPNMIVGDIEPYPHFSVAELEAWTDAVVADGQKPAFFHLDVDLERVRVEGQPVKADLQRLSQFFGDRGIPFGVIFTSNWRAAGSDRAYFESTMGWVHTVDDAIGVPAHLIFQSWQGPAPSGANEVPINLPESDPPIYSHTRLILEGLAVFGR